MIKHPCLAAMAEEITAMRSGRFIPYHKMALAVAILVTLFFSAIYSHSAVFEGRIAVIDLDHSSLSAQFIDALDSSSYLNVTAVYPYPQPVTKLSAHDAVLGVLYIPRGMEELTANRHLPFKVRYYADYLNEAQNARVMETLNAITGEFGGSLSSGTVGAIAPGGELAAQAVTTPLSVETRRLFNPTYAASSGMVSAFLCFFSGLYMALTTLMIPGRLRVTHRFEEAVLKGSFLSLCARIVPYAFFFTTAIVLLEAILSTFGQLRFAGSVLLYLPALFIIGLAIGILALTLAFNAADPGAGAARMIFLIPPGFILSGATMAVGIFTQGAQLLSHLFPLVWLFHLQRDLLGRGLNFAELADLYGCLLIYLTFCMTLLAIRFYRAQHALQKTPPQPAPN